MITCLAHYSLKDAEEDGGRFRQPNIHKAGDSAPAQVEVAPAGGRLAGEEVVDDARDLHHAAVLAQVVLRLGQEHVLVPVAPQQHDLPHKM